MFILLPYITTLTFLFFFYITIISSSLFYGDTITLYHPPPITCQEIISILLFKIQSTPSIYILLNAGLINEEEIEYVINTLLNKERVEEKIETSKGYIGTVQKINGQFHKIFNVEKIKSISES